MQAVLHEWIGINNMFLLFCGPLIILINTSKNITGILFKILCTIKCVVQRFYIINSQVYVHV